ncbi:MAG: hypothetical protein AAGF24_15125 [Cyanobacteria bacterium P01_H01_bin.121]
MLGSAQEATLQHHIQVIWVSEDQLANFGLAIAISIVGDLMGDLMSWLNELA